MKLLVFFDLDSTLVKIEGLDWLAEYKGKDGEIKRLTKNAMEGLLPFKQALLKKLEIIKPTKTDFKILSQAYIKNLIPEAKETVQTLLNRNVGVFIITGSFIEAVEPLAKLLNIKKENIFTNKIFWDKNGNYAGIDLNNPLSSNGGKPKIVKKILKNFNPKPYSIFVGDSITDLETKKVVDVFVGVGGVVTRKKVKENADVFIYDLKEVLKVCGIMD